MTTYPLLQILVYIALLFAPSDATRITIAGPAPTDAQELRLTVNGWAVMRDGVEYPVSLSETRLLVKHGDKSEATELGEHIAAVKGHDWTAAPKLKLAALTTLEKTDTGFRFRQNDEAGGDARTYTIAYHRPAPTDPATATISVNVIGAVNKPGAYKLTQGATILEAIAAAGGCTRLAVKTQIRLVRGSSGEKPQIFDMNVEELRLDPSKAMPIKDHDTIFVPERIL